MAIFVKLGIKIQFSSTRRSSSMLFFAKHHKNWTFCVNLKLFMVKVAIFWQRYKWTLHKTQERLKPHGKNSTFPQNQKLQLPGIGPICKPALKAKISLYVNRSRKVKNSGYFFVWNFTYFMLLPKLKHDLFLQQSILSSETNIK